MDDTSDSSLVSNSSFTKDTLGLHQCDNSRRICTHYLTLKMIPLLLAIAMSNSLILADAFVFQTPAPAFVSTSAHTMTQTTSTRLCMDCHEEFRDGDEGSEEIWGGDGDLDAPSEAIDDLSWRVAKLRLEEENTRRFLKAGPRFLPYDECRNWVMAWNRWDTEEDWKEWIREGEKRNAYIPARPDEYYGKLGHWISWDHFLGKEKVNEASCTEDSGEDDDPNKIL